MVVFFSPPTLSKILTPTLVDKLYIDTFNAEDDDKKIQIIQKTNFNMVVRLSCNDSVFQLYCNHPELKTYWSKKWCAYGVVLSVQEQLKPVLFHAQSNLNNCDLVRGAYFFHLAKAVKNKMKADFMCSEMAFIKQAVKYGSVHAIQRYNEYLYYKLQSASDEDKDGLYNELIVNSQLMLPAYGSYGHMVVAEAFGSYALWLLEANQMDRAKDYYASTLTSIDCATAILEDSRFSILNASLGRGLKCSNSLAIDNPHEARGLFKEKFEELFSVVQEMHHFGPRSILTSSAIQP